MLVLTRKRNQTIRINDDITITVLKTGSRVQIGIEAPQHMRIRRGEVSDANVDVDDSYSPHLLANAVGLDPSLCELAFS